MGFEIPEKYQGNLTVLIEGQQTKRTKPFYFAYRFKHPLRVKIAEIIQQAYNVTAKVFGNKRVSRFYSGANEEFLEKIIEIANKLEKFRIDENTNQTIDNLLMNELADRNN